MEAKAEMNLRDAQLASALVGWRQMGDLKERSAADNIHFEERVSAARQQKFEGEAVGSANVASLRRAHIDYWKTFVEVDDGIPDTFDAGLTPAGVGTIDGSQKLVRIESLVRPLEKHGITFEELKKSYDNNEAAVVEGYLRVWNQSNVRDFRPAFAAFKDEVREDLARADGPLGFETASDWLTTTVPPGRFPSR